MRELCGGESCECGFGKLIGFLSNLGAIGILLERYLLMIRVKWAWKKFEENESIMKICLTYAALWHMFSLSLH